MKVFFILYPNLFFFIKLVPELPSVWEKGNIDKSHSFEPNRSGW